MGDFEVKLQTISGDNFAAYGSLIETNGRAASFSSEVFSYWDALNAVAFDGSVSFGILESYPGPSVAVNLERHVRTSETLVPLDGEVVLVVGQPTSGETADLRTVAAFRISQGRAATLNPGVWHYVPLAVDKTSRTMVVFRLGTPEEDLLVDEIEATRGKTIRVIA